MSLLVAIDSEGWLLNSIIGSNLKLFLTKGEQYISNPALGESILTGHLSREGKEELALKIDKWFRVLYLLCFVLISLIIFKLL